MNTEIANNQNINTDAKISTHSEMNKNNENLGCQDKVLAEQGAVVESTTETLEVNGSEKQNPEAAVTEPKEASPKKEEPAKKEKKTIEVHSRDVKNVQDNVIRKLLVDPGAHAIQIPGTNNVVINLTEAVRGGAGLRRQTKNRVHGKDEQRTGESICQYGSQVPLVVIHQEVADAAGIKYERFSTDPNKGKNDEPQIYVLLEGHGRIEYLMGLAVDKWPTVLAVFPSQDANNELHPDKALIEANINTTKWMSHDYGILRLSDPTHHKGWDVLKGYEDMGFGFTIASILTTGREGTINKRTILSADTDCSELFKNLPFCKRLSEAAFKVFGTEKRSVLQTKVIPNAIFSCWEDIKSGKYDAEQATSLMEEFLKTLTKERGESITKATKEGSYSRDDIRKQRFLGYFDGFKKEKGIE